MPSELRHILFRPNEVVRAVGEYQRRLGKPVPWGDVSWCGPELCDAGQVRFRIRFATTAEGQARNGHALFENEVLVAALIMHCRERGIPLPAKAEKSLQRFGEQLCLVAAINTHRSELAAG